VWFTRGMKLSYARNFSISQCYVFPGTKFYYMTGGFALASLFFGVRAASPVRRPLVKSDRFLSSLWVPLVEALWGTGSSEEAEFSHRTANAVTEFLDTRSGKSSPASGSIVPTELGNAAFLLVVVLCLGLAPYVGGHFLFSMFLWADVVSQNRLSGGVGFSWLDFCYFAAVAIVWAFEVSDSLHWAIRIIYGLALLHALGCFVVGSPIASGSPLPALSRQRLLHPIALVASIVGRPDERPLLVLVLVVGLVISLSAQRLAFTPTNRSVTSTLWRTWAARSAVLCQASACFMFFVMLNRKFSLGVDVTAGQVANELDLRPMVAATLMFYHKFYIVFITIAWLARVDTHSYSVSRSVCTSSTNPLRWVWDVLTLKALVLLCTFHLAFYIYKVRNFLSTRYLA
jgi:hypothetical protein